MEVWGLILNGLGAVLVAIGQEDVNRSIRLWLEALQVSSETAARGSGPVITGVDAHMQRSINRNRILSRIGWTVFVIGIILQIISHFWKAA